MYNLFSDEVGVLLLVEETFYFKIEIVSLVKYYSVKKITVVKFDAIF